MIIKEIKLPYIFDKGTHLRILKRSKPFQFFRDSSLVVLSKRLTGID